MNYKGPESLREKVEGAIILSVIDPTLEVLVGIDDFHMYHRRTGFTDEGKYFEMIDGLVRKIRSLKDEREFLSGRN